MVSPPYQAQSPPHTSEPDSILGEPDYKPEYHDNNNYHNHDDISFEPQYTDGNSYSPPKEEYIEPYEPYIEPYEEPYKPYIEPYAPYEEPYEHEYPSLPAPFYEYSSPNFRPPIEAKPIHNTHHKIVKVAQKNKHHSDHHDSFRQLFATIFYYFSQVLSNLKIIFIFAFITFIPISCNTQESFHTFNTLFGL